METESSKAVFKQEEKEDDVKEIKMEMEKGQEANA